MAFAALTIDLNARLAKFEQDMSKAGRSMDSLNSRAAALSTGLKAVFAGIGVASIAAFAKSTLDAADAFTDLSDRTGVAVKDLASLELAAKLSDTSLDGVGKAIQRLNLSVGQAQAGNAKIAESLAALGVNSKDARERLFQLADAYKASGGQGKVLSDIQAVLGKSYVDLIPFLKQGGDGLRELARQSESYADTIARLAPDAAEFNDQLDTLRQNSALAAAEIMTKLVPAMNAILENIQQANRLSAAGFNFLDVLGLGVNPTQDPAKQLKTVQNSIVELEADINRLRRNSGGRDQSIPTLEARVADLKKLRQILIEQEASRLLRPPVRSDEVVADMSIVVFPPEKTKQIDKAKMALEDIEQAMRDAADEMERFSKLRAADQEVWDDYRNTLDLVTAEQAEYAAAVESSRQQIVDMIDPSARLVRQLAELDKFEGVLDPELLALARLELNAQIDALQNMVPELKKTQSLAEEIGLTFTSAFEDAVVAGKDFSDVLQAIEADIIRILVRRNVTEPLLSAVSGFDLGSLFGFASGGVMTGSGPLPLNKYASGGIASTPQLALFGEGSGAEAYVPLPDGRRIPVAMEGAGGVQVNVINNSGAQANTSERNEGGTRVIDIIIDQVRGMISGDIAKGGNAVSGSLERTYGLNRTAGAY
jgi:DNA repair exonuclease SbcCD ATPase subunit